MNPVMLATDGSPSAEAATQEAVELAQRLDLPLLVASVEHQPIPSYGYYGYAEVTAELAKLERRRIYDLFASIRSRAEELGLEVETVELRGAVGEQLCAEARRRRPRLLVVGAHGWGRVGRFVHGSVSTYILHHSPVPVLIVQGSDREEQMETATAATARTI